MAGASIRVGVDFGGTKIEVAALDEAGTPIVRKRLPTPGDYDSALHSVRDLVRSIENETAEVDRLGVGAPGSISPKTGLLRNSNTIYLNGKPFAEDLERTLGKRVRLSNDANCLALSEAVDGAAAGAQSVFAVIIGTGCGGGLVIDGKLIHGANGIAGEWGHNPLPWPSVEEVKGAPRCWCGQIGCQELWISGSGLQRDYFEATGIRATGEAIITASRRGERDAVAAFERYAERLARSLASIVNLVDPEVIVLGGGMANVTELYALLPSLMRRHVFSDAFATRILQARWGDSSGVRGAARLWTTD